MNYQLLLFSLLLAEVLTRRQYLNCEDLALIGIFNTEHCCKECHALVPKQGIVETLIHDGYHGRDAYLCCHCSLMIHGRQEVPDHWEEYPGA